MGMRLHHKVLENWCVAIVVCVCYDGYGAACGRGLKETGLLLLWFMFSDGYGVAHDGV